MGHTYEFESSSSSSIAKSEHNILHGKLYHINLLLAATCFKCMFSILMKTREPRFPYLYYQATVSFRVAM